MAVYSKVKHIVFYESALLFVGIYSRKLNADVRKKTINVAHVSSLPNSQKLEITQTPSTAEGTNCEYSHTKIPLNSTEKKKNELLIYVTTWICFKSMM